MPVMTRILPFGEQALLAEVDSLAEVLALHARLVATRPAGVRELVPAARTVLVRVAPGILPLAAARSWVAGTHGGSVVDDAPPRVVELPIAYDGEDLPALAASLGLAPEDLVAQHAVCEWTVAFTGFAPGFGYLVSDDWHYDIPRLTSPRTRVPAGAVGLAGPFSGAYPRETPGGWQRKRYNIVTRAADGGYGAAPALEYPGYIAPELEPVDVEDVDLVSAMADPNPPVEGVSRIERRYR